MTWRTPARFGALVAIALGVWACGLERTGAAIFDPERSHVDAPGQRITTGRYTRVGVDPFGPDGPLIVGFRLDSEPPSLALAPFNGKPGCQVQPAQAYGVLAPGTEPVRLLPYLEKMNGSGFGTLRFIDTSCRAHFEPIEDARLPQHSLKEGQGFVTRLATGALVKLDPWRGRQEIISDRFSHHEFSFRHHWFLENGELVVLNEMLEVVARAGTAVQELLVIGQDGLRAVIVDEHELFVMRDFASDLKLVDSDVCNVTSLPGQNTLAYHSPCEKRQLVVYDLGKQTRTTYDVDTAPQAFRLVRDTNGRTWSYYLTDYDPQTRLGTLWVTPPDEAPVRIGERADLGWANFPGLSVSGSSPLGLALIDIDPQTRAGRFVSFERDGSVTERATNVARHFRNGLLINFDGTVGDLARASSARDPQPVVLAKGVPVHQFAVNADITPPTQPTPAEAFLSEYRGAAGTLVARMIEQRGSGPEFHQRAVANGVPIGGFRMLHALPGLAYLKDFDLDSATGRLEIWNYALDVPLPVAGFVSEFEEIVWPHAGILYNVPSGPRSGIWFARAK